MAEWEVIKGYRDKEFSDTEFGELAADYVAYMENAKDAYKLKEDYFSYFYDQISDKQLLKKNHFSHIMIIAVILTYTLKNTVYHFRERKAHYIITLQPQPEDECCCSAHFLLFVRPGAPAQGCPHSR